MYDRQEDKIKEWTKLINRYIALHKYLKEVGKITITQSKTGQVKDDVQIQLGDTLNQIEKTLNQMKDFFHQRLPLSKIKDAEAATVSGNSTTTETEITKLQEQIQLEEAKNQSLLEENIRLKSISEDKPDGIFQLYPTKEIGHDLQLMHMEETLKIQNDLIEDLKLQLSDSNKEREMFKNLNLKLEAELLKRHNEGVLVARIEEDESETLEAGIRVSEVSGVEGFSQEELLKQLDGLNRELSGVSFERDCLKIENEGFREQQVKFLELIEVQRMKNACLVAQEMGTLKI